MTNAILDRSRRLLEAKAMELDRVVRDRRGLAIERTAEELEQIALAAQRELAIGALDRDSRLLKEVRAALARIDDGSYGVCESCEEAIKPKRLDAVPWTRRCVACQERADRGPHPGDGGPAWRLGAAA